MQNAQFGVNHEEWALFKKVCKSVPFFAYNSRNGRFPGKDSTTENGVSGMQVFWDVATERHKEAG